MSDEVEAQRRLKTAILERVRDLEGAEHLAYALIETGFDIIAGQHRPAKLTPADRAAILPRTRMVRSSAGRPCPGRERKVTTWSCSG